jgi:hypothetical protein
VETANTAIAITAPRTRPSQHANGNGAGRGSRPQARHNGFSPPMGLSPHTSDRAAIAGLRPHTVKKGAKDSEFGGR